MKATRSVIRFGRAFVVTLPADFVSMNKIKPGQEVFALKNRSFLLITPDRETARRFQAELDKKTQEAKKRAEEAQDRVHEEEHEALLSAAVEEATEEVPDE